MEHILMRHAYEDDRLNLIKIICRGLAESNHRDKQRLLLVADTIRAASPKEIQMVTSDTERAAYTAKIIANEIGYNGNIETDQDLEEEISQNLFDFENDQNSLKLIVSHQPPIEDFLWQSRIRDYVRTADTYRVSAGGITKISE